MPSNVSKGRSLEYAVRDRLRSMGYVVFRCAGSRPVDIVAIREGKILLVECKTGKHPSIAPKQLSRILEISKTVGAIPVLAVRKKHREIKLFKMMEPGLGGTGLKAVSQVDG